MRHDINVNQPVSDLLLDTHAFIWLMNGDATLSSSTQDYIQTVCQNNLLYLSAISIWEIAMLHNKEKLSFSQPLNYWIEKATSLPAIKVIPIDSTIALESCQLPGSFHGDPADRMIVATARLFNVPLMTRDQKILDYANRDYLKVIAC